jgi:putative membrane protein
VSAGRVTSISQRALGIAARRLAARRLELRVDGAAHLPADGPVLLAVRHAHHFWDGVALLAAVPRPLHLVVALDWVGTPALRRAMERATRAAAWPVLLRAEAIAARAAGVAGLPPSAYAADEVPRYGARALREGVALLAAGRALAVFPEGFPAVDPHWTPRRQPDEWLPFQRGFVHFAAAAERRLGRAVPIVPVGVAYAEGVRRVAQLRFGRPTQLAEHAGRAALVRSIESRVRRLSAPPVEDARPGSSSAA